ncbi:helix-turn-helix domain-containing protein [Nonomuraea purpurea]|uniref:Helix-turn-helix domain-containing protein n=1 Tax=Nonomuraea purpurea TaxID=1849276 RepID=A0ABV8GRD1_9ACTN
MYAELPPDPDLAARITCVWHQVSEADTTQLVVPDACVDLIWGPDGVFVAGPDTGPMPAAMSVGDVFVGIRFKAGATGDVFGVPLPELRDQRVSLSDLPGPVRSVVRHAPAPGTAAPPAAYAMPGGLPDPVLDAERRDPALSTAPRELVFSAERRDQARLAAWRDPEGLHDLDAVAAGWWDGRLELEALAAGRWGPDLEALDAGHLDLAGRLDVLRSAVRGLLSRSPAPDRVAPAIATALRTGRTVSEVAWDLGFSERQLHRRSLASFGYSPKTLQRIVRFQRALRIARTGVRLAEVAADAGYTDQAHLAHDVRRLSGMPMSRLLSPVRMSS